MLAINENLFVSLKIDDKEVQFVNLIAVTLTEGSGALVPAIKIELSDPTSSLITDNALTEGNKIEIVVSRSIKEHTKPRKYRIFGPARGNAALTSVQTILGILNAPKYISASSRESFKGTSEEVLNDIASASGLDYYSTVDFNGRVCNDEQTWLNVCKNRASFIQEITRHGWMDKYSGMASCVTSHGVLKYQNLIDVVNTPAEKIKYVFTHNTLSSSTDDSKKRYLVKEAKGRSSGGAMSSWMNYGSTRVVNKLGGVPEDVKSLDVKTPGSYLAINKDVADEVKRARYDYAPIDCGNTHQKYEDAVYQNLKILALFSEKLSILVDVVTEVALFDPIIYRQADADLAEPVANTDIYVVVGKSIVIRGGIHYAERIELARMSLTMKGDAKLQTPSNVASERSMIPDVSINKSAIGTVGREMSSTLQSVSGQMNSMGGVVSALDGIQSSVAKTLASTQASVSKYVTSLAAGTGVGEALGGVYDSAKLALSSITKAASIYKDAKYQSESLLSATKDLPNALKQASLTKPGSYLSSLSSQASSLMPFTRSVDSLKSVAKSVPVKFNSIDSVTGLTNTLNQCESLLKGSQVDFASQWNQGISSMRGVPLPGQTVATDTMRQFDNLMQRSSTTAKDAEKFLGREITRDSSKNANWMPDDAFVGPPFVSVEKSLDTVTNMQKRAEEQGLLYA